MNSPSLKSLWCIIAAKPYNGRLFHLSFQYGTYLQFLVVYSRTCYKAGSEITKTCLWYLKDDDKQDQLGMFILAVLVELLPQSTSM